MKTDTRVEGPWEEGNWEAGGQGRRSDLEDVYDMLKEERSLLEVLEEHPGTFIRYGRGIKDAKFMLNQVASREFRHVKCTVLIGKAGVGKTRLVYGAEGLDKVFKLDQGPRGAIWFDGYSGEDTLLIDEFYGWIEWSMFLNMLDGYQLRLPVKNGHAWARWTKVYITSNKDINTWFEQGTPPELKRRIFRVFEIVTK